VAFGSVAAHRPGSHPTTPFPPSFHHLTGLPGFASHGISLHQGAGCQ